jgi:hypothetical protein
MLAELAGPGVVAAAANIGCRNMDFRHLGLEAAPGCRLNPGGDPVMKSLRHVAVDDGRGREDDPGNLAQFDGRRSAATARPADRRLQRIDDIEAGECRSAG